MQVRHPLTLITKETRPLDITVENTCLLLQDLHSPFTDADDGWLVNRINQKVLMREFDDYFHLLDLIRPNIPRVLEAARQMGIRVAYSCFGHNADESPSSFRKPRAGHGTSTGRWVNIPKSGSRGPTNPSSPNPAGAPSATPNSPTFLPKTTFPTSSSWAQCWTSASDRPASSSATGAFKA